MKLKDQTFAVIAEKVNSKSHKWFNDNDDTTYGKWRWKKGTVHKCENGNLTFLEKEIPKDIPIYTESEFEKLIEQEEMESKVPTEYDGMKTILGTGGVIAEYIAMANQFQNHEPKLTITNQFAREIIAERFKLTANDIRIEP